MSKYQNAIQYLFQKISVLPGDEVMILRTDFTRHVNVSGLDAHFAAQRVDNSRTIGTNKTRFRLTFEGVHDLERMMVNCAVSLSPTH